MVVEGAMNKTIKRLLLEVTPCRVSAAIEHVDYVDMWTFNQPRIYTFEVEQCIIELFNDRIIDINYDKNGHPWMVYSNWTVVCPIVNRR